MPDRPRVAARTTVVVGLALLASGCVSESRDLAGDVSREPPPADAVRVVMDDNVFVPDELTAVPGEQVVLDVVNEGRAPHNLVVDDLDLSTGTMPGGDAVVARFTMPDEPVDFVCTFHPGMDGTITPAG